MDINTKKSQETEVGQILAGIDKISEQYGERLEKLGGEFTQLQESWEEGRKRIQALEDKKTNPEQRYVSKYGSTDLDRRDALCEWFVDCYNAAHGFPYNEARADMNKTTDAAGGYLVPDPLSAEIVRIVQMNGDARRLFRNIPMTADTLRINTKSTGVTVAFVNEGVNLGNTGAEFGQKTLTAQKLGAYSVITWELEQDAIRPIVPYLIDLFGEAIAAKEDDACFTGTSPFTGIFVDSDLSTQEVDMASTTFASITYDNLVDTMHKVDVNTIFNGTWVMHPSVFAAVRKLKDNDGQPLWAPLAAGAPATILGRPYVLANRAPSTEGAALPVLMYGQWQYGAFGTRNQLSVDFSDHYAFISAGRTMRVLERFAYVTLEKTAFARLMTP